MTIIVIQHSDTRYTWLAVDAHGHIQTESDYHSIKSLPSILNKERMIVLLAGEQVVLKTARLPKVNSSELARAIPFALEEELVADVESLHFAIGDYNDHDHLTVAVMNRAWFESLLAEFSQVGLKPDVCLPVYLALPLKKQTWSLVADANLIYVRTGYQAGFTVDSVNLSKVINRAIKASEQPPQTLLLNQISPDAIRGDLSIEMVAQSGPLSAALDLLGLVDAPAINCLQGEYRPRRRAVKSSKQWVFCGLALVMLVVVGFSGRATQLLYFKHQRAQTTAQIKQVYRQIFPGAKAVLEPRFRLRELVKQLGFSSKGNSFVGLLSASGKVLAAHLQVSLQGVRFANQRLVVSVQASTLAQLEAFTKDLSGAGLKSQQTQLSVKPNNVTASLSLSRSGK